MWRRSNREFGCGSLTQNACLDGRDLSKPSTMAAVTTSVCSGASSRLSSEDLDPRIDSTIKALDWDTLLLGACAACRCTSATWAGQLTGGYNFVRLLQLDDQTEIVRQKPDNRSPLLRPFATASPARWLAWNTL